MSIEQRITVISNLPMQIFQKTFEYPFIMHDLSVHFSFYDTSDIQSAFDQDSTFRTDLVVVLINFEEQYPHIYMSNIDAGKANDEVIRHAQQFSIEVYTRIRENTSAPVLWFGLEDYYVTLDYVFGTHYRRPINVDAINNQVSTIMSEKDAFVDLKRVIARIGFKAAFNPKWMTMWGMPYSERCAEELGNELYKY